MAGELILRYWPVDGAFPQSSYVKFGVATRVQTPTLPYFEYDPSDPTMYQVGYDYNLDGDGVGPKQIDQYRYRYANAASVVSLGGEGLVEGEYAEAAVRLLGAGGTVIPVGLEDMPLTLYLVGLSGNPQRYENPPRWSDPGGYTAGIEYAGGVIQVGLYEAGEFVSLGSAWVDGSFFTPKGDGSSWSNPALPPEANVRYDEETNFIYMDLAPTRPVEAFWTQRVQATETL